MVCDKILENKYKQKKKGDTNERKRNFTSNIFVTK